MHKGAALSPIFVLLIAAAIVALVPGRSALSASAPAPVLSPPQASMATNTPLGAIGALERNRKTAPAQLQRFLDDNDPVVRARALLALARIGNNAALPQITDALSDPKGDDGVRAMAAFALGVFASPDSIDALTQAISRGPSPVAAAATEALGRIGGPRAVEVLTRQLSSRDSAVRSAAAVGLGEAGIPGATSIDAPHRAAASRALAAVVMVERDQEAKWRQAWALSRSFFDQTAVLRRLLNDDQELVRLFAVRGLGKAKDRSYLLPLRLAVNDPSWRVRVEVRNALSNFHDKTPVNLKPPAVPKSDQVTPDPVASNAPYGDHPEVAFDTTKGFIVIELFPDQAPYSVDNFLALTDRGFYNDLSYFRVIEDFVVQGGDPKNTGVGGPGYSIPAELNPLQQLTGIISYGLDYENNGPLLDSAGSQYYITQSPQLHLDRAFTVFGRVVKGMAVVDAISPHQAGDAQPADVARRVYRCKSVIAQTADNEAKLRNLEIGFDAR